jgi:ornithine decarboxylase
MSEFDDEVIPSDEHKPSICIEPKINEYKDLDNTFLQKYDVKLYGSESDIYEIINDFLQKSQSEEAFFIVDLGEIVSAYNNWVRLLPDVKPYYAMKCNPNPVIMEALASLGANFDCASQQEIRSAIDITGDPSRIIFANPIKMNSQIKYARSNDVDLMTFDAEDELFKIKLYHPQCNLVLRLAVDDSHSKCQFNSKFGCKVEDVEKILNIAKTLKLNIIGFSFHVGSGCMSSEVYYEALRECRKATDIASRMGFSISLIDIGGGFQYIDREVKFENVAMRINDGIEEFFKEELDAKTIEFIAEPGRYFAEKTHTLVLNVIGKKQKVDAASGENINVYYLNESTYGSFNCIHNDHYTPNLLPFNERNEKLFKSTVFGFSCDSADKICEHIWLPDLAIGETVLVECMGAYTCCASSIGFNGFAPTSKYQYIYKDHLKK